MSQLFDEAKLEKKLGPLPVWAWAAVAAGIAYYVFKRRQDTAAAIPATTQGDPTITDSTDADTTDTADGTDGTFDPNTAIDDWLGNNPTSAAYPTGYGSGLPAPITNAQWASSVSDELLAKGDDPSLVETALAKYLNGTSLSAAEQAVVNTALTLVGSPPEGVQAVVLTPPATTTTPPPVKTTTPPPVKTVTTKSPFTVRDARVGQVGQKYTLTSYIASLYPGSTAKQQQMIAFFTALDPRNAAYKADLQKGFIPGGAHVYFAGEDSEGV